MNQIAVRFTITSRARNVNPESLFSTDKAAFGNHLRKRTQGGCKKIDHLRPPIGRIIRPRIRHVRASKHNEMFFAKNSASRLRSECDSSILRKRHWPTRLVAEDPVPQKQSAPEMAFVRPSLWCRPFRTTLGRERCYWTMCAAAFTGGTPIGALGRSSKGPTAGTLFHIDMKSATSNMVVCAGQPSFAVPRNADRHAVGATKISKVTRARSCPVHKAATHPQNWSARDSSGKTLYYRLRS